MTIRQVFLSETLQSNSLITMKDGFEMEYVQNLGELIDYKSKLTLQRKENSSISKNRSLPIKYDDKAM